MSQKIRKCYILHMQTLQKMTQGKTKLLCKTATVHCVMEKDKIRAVKKACMLSGSYCVPLAGMSMYFHIKQLKSGLGTYFSSHSDITPIECSVTNRVVVVVDFFFFFLISNWKAPGFHTT